MVGYSDVTSLSIPPLSASSHQSHARFLVISEEEILHAAGNTLRISKFRPEGQDPNSSSRSRDERDGVISNDDTGTTGTCSFKVDQDVHGQQSIVFAEAERLRGFSCFCFNSYRRRVAYSPRRPSPSIFIKTLIIGVSGSQQQQQQLQDVTCELKGGASIEYQDMCFNRDGSRLAAIGKGYIDSALYVWDIHIEETTKCGGLDDDDDDCPVNAPSTLIATIRFDEPALTCLFDPCNDGVVSILCCGDDGTTKNILKCNLKRSIGRQRKVITEKIELDDPNLVEEDTKISTMAWESDSRLLLGTSDGSVFLLEKDSKEPTVVLVSSIKLGSVRKINITACHVIIGFETGKVLWLLRPNNDSEYKLESHAFEVYLGDDIFQMFNTPDYRDIVVYTKGGKMHYLPIDGVQNHEENKQNYCTNCARFPTETVTALTSVVMAGKAGVPLLVTGDTNGYVNAWREIDPHENALDFDGLFGSIDLGAPITCIETLTGFPVCVVGLADSSIKFIHIARAKDRGWKEKCNCPTIDLDLVELKSEVLCSSPITHLRYNPRNKKLAAGCFHSGHIFVLCTEPSNLHVIGVMQIEKETLSVLRWSDSEASTGILLAGSHNGSVSCFDITPLCFTYEPLKPLWMHEVSSGSCVREIITGNDSSLLEKLHDDAAVFICDSADGIEIYEANMSNERLDCIEMMSSIKTATGQVIELLVSRNHIAFGTRYGSVDFIQHATCSGKTCEVVQSLYLHCSAVIAMCFSSDASKVYSSGLDGSIFVQRLCDPCPIQNSSYDYDYLVSQIIV